jgi:hypothetical protein
VSTGRSSDASHHALVEASLVALDRVLTSGAASRDSAFDLLSSDAFITYAFEAAADEPDVVSQRADAAMRRISDRAVEFLDQQ